jgi:hypothetical protein
MRLLLTLLICTGLASAQSSPFHWKGSVAQGRAIEVRGINGDVFAEGYDGPDVEIVANVADESGVVTPVNVQVVESDKGVTVCTTYIGPDPDRQGKCVGEIASETDKKGARVNFTVRVPKGVGLIGRTVNGAVQAENLDADVEAYTVNGKIRISTTGSAQARTINGSIFASLSNPFWRQRREFSTVNGSITLNLPAQFSTQVRAETINGRVSTAFRLRNPARHDDRVVEGAIGCGGAGLKLKTVNGSIQLNKVT